MKKLLALTLFIVGCALGNSNSSLPGEDPVPKSHVADSDEGKPSSARQAAGELESEQQTDLAASTRRNRDVTVSARCVDELGAPMAGIELVAMSVPGEPSAKSNAEGLVELVLTYSQAEDFAPHVPVFVLRSPLTVAVSKRFRVKPYRDKFLGEFTLLEGGAVQGRVVDSNGAPVAGASVHCSEPVLERHTDEYKVRRITGTSPNSLVAKTGSDGRYLIQGVRPAAYSVSAYKPASLRSLSDPITVVRGQVAEVNSLMLESAPASALVKGRVLNEDGSPRANVRVRWIGPNRIRLLSETVASPLGEFAFTVEPGSVGTVMAGRTAHAPLFAYDVEAGTTDLEIKKRERAKILIEARATDGSALTELTVTAHAIEGMAEASGYGRSGSGEPIELTLPDREFEVVAWADGFTISRQGPFDPASAPDVFKVDLQPLPLLTGEVRSGEELVSGAEVEGYLSMGNHAATLLASGLYRLDLYGIRFVGYAGQSGSFKHAPGDWSSTFGGHLNVDAWLNLGFKSLHLRARGTGYAFGPEKVIPLESLKGENEVVLQVAKPGAMEGRVRATGAIDFNEWSISISRGDMEIVTWPLGENGEYRWDELAPGKWQAVLRPRSRSSRADRFPVRAGAAEDIAWSFEVHEGELTHFDLEHEFVPEPKGHLSGTFLVNGEAPVAWYWRAFQDYDTLAEGQFDAQGRFEFEGAVSSSIELFVGEKFERDCGGTGFREQLQLTEGENEWSYDMSSASLLLTGLPEYREDPDRPEVRVSDVYWVASWDDETRNLNWTSQTRCGPQGTQMLTHVPAGTVTLVKHEWPSGSSSTPMVLELQPGDRHVLRVWN